MEKYIVPGSVFLIFVLILVIVMIYPKHGDKLKFWKPNIQKEWDALYERIAQKPRQVITTCERPTAGPDSPFHLRYTNEADMKVGGGIPADALTLCGVSLDRGWDRQVADRAYLTAAWNSRASSHKPGQVCPLCLDEVKDQVISDGSVGARGSDV